MATFTGEVEVEVPQSDVWAFVKDIDNWAHLFPGHQRHLEVEKDHFSWQLRGEAGVWSRLVEFDVQVIEWSDPDYVRFSIKGRTEPVVGSGMCFAKPAPGSTDTSLVGFQLDAHATGAAAPMINMLLKKFVTEQSGPFLERLSATVNGRRHEQAQTAAASGTGTSTATPNTERSVAIAATVLAQGPGTVIITYRAPRTTGCEEWLREFYTAVLWRDEMLMSSRRLEGVATGPLGDYQDVLETHDVARTVRHVTELVSQLRVEADARGVSFAADPYVARCVSVRRRPWPMRLLRRAQRA